MRETSLPEDFDWALSPVREAAAYEALWDEEGASVKRIAETICTPGFDQLSMLRPSHVLDKYTDKLREIIKKLNGDFGICFIGEADYPTKLLDAKYPVPLLYYKGVWDLIFSPSVAVVGTRHPTLDGIKRTQKLVKLLINDGYTIVSGLASGIDTVAHETAISQEGNTIAVIGTSLDNFYPKENKKLQSQIAKNHLVVSQVPFIRYQHQNPQSNRFFFPERNKTMSALTLGTIIVEAGETSGSLIQAKAALEQGRKLFILDSCFQNKDITWPEKFLEKGAIRVKDYEDICKQLDLLTDEA